MSLGRKLGSKPPFVTEFALECKSKVDEIISTPPRQTGENWELYAHGVGAWNSEAERLPVCTKLGVGSYDSNATSKHNKTMTYRVFRCDTFHVHEARSP